MGTPPATTASWQQARALVLEGIEDRVADLRELAIRERLAELAAVLALWIAGATLAVAASRRMPAGGLRYLPIGIGVLRHFNGNDPSTIVALGTLDALSAGILCWVGLVSMWAHDWLYGELREAPLVKTAVAFVSLVCGMLLMGVLGKWA